MTLIVLRVCSTHESWADSQPWHTTPTCESLTSCSCNLLAQEKKYSLSPSPPSLSLSLTHSLARTHARTHAQGSPQGAAQTHCAILLGSRFYFILWKKCQSGYSAGAADNFTAQTQYLYCLLQPFSLPKCIFIHIFHLLLSFCWVSCPCSKLQVCLGHYVPAYQHW